MSELDNATEATTEQVGKMIEASLGYNPGLGEPEPDFETEQEEQTEAPEEKAVVDETPAVETEVRPDAGGEVLALEAEVVADDDDDAKAESDYSPRETALYARLQKTKTKLNTANTETTGLKERLANVEGKVSVLAQPADAEAELINPLDVLEDWENPTAGQLRDYAVYQEKAAVKQVSKQRQEHSDRVDQYLRETDAIGATFYDDWDKVITPAIGAAIKADPQKNSEVLMAGSTIKAAKVAYRIAKELSSGKRTEALAPAAPPLKKPNINNKPNQNFAVKQDAIARQVSNALHAADTEEEVNTLLEGLAQLGIH